MDEYGARDKDLDYDHDTPAGNMNVMKKHAENLPSPLQRRATEAKTDGPGPPAANPPSGLSPSGQHRIPQPRSKVWELFSGGGVSYAWVAGQSEQNYNR